MLRTYGADGKHHWCEVLNTMLSITDMKSTYSNKQAILPTANQNYMTRNIYIQDKYKTGTHKKMYIPALETILKYYNFHLYIFYFEPKENLTGNVYFVATFLLPFLPGFHAGIFDTTRRASLSREGLTERTISG